MQESKPCFFKDLKEGDSHTILYLTLRQNMTTAREGKEFTLFPAELARDESRTQRQEANRQTSQAKGSPKGQGKTKRKVKGKSE